MNRELILDLTTHLMTEVEDPEFDMGTGLDWNTVNQRFNVDNGT